MNVAKHRQGEKMGRHTTLIDAAEGVVDAARKMQVVSRVSLGQIRKVPTGQRAIKFVEVNGGWKVTIRGNTSLQEIVVYTTNPKAARKQLEAAFR